MRRVTVKDLANELGLSLGAINKALNNKPGVSDATRALILETADKMGYRVNKVAQSMARSTIKIGVVLPTSFPEYFDSLRRGVDQQFEALRDYNVDCEYYFVKSLHAYHETVEVLRRCVADGKDGVILYPPQEFGPQEELQKLQQQKIPVVLIGSDIPDSGRLCCVRVDARCAGRMAAEFISLILAPHASVIAFVGNKDMNEHREKAEAFTEEACGRGMNVLGVYETHDDADIAYFLTEKIIRECERVDGIYIATANSASVCRYLQEHGIQNIKVVGTDVFQAAADYMQSGVMQGVVFQNAERQGSVALRILYQYLAENHPCATTEFVSPQLVLNNNIRFYIS